MQKIPLEKKRAVLINLAFFLAVFGIVYFLICYALPWMMPFLFAYFVAKYGYSMAPLAVGIVLGSTIETGLTQGMIICEGSVWKMMTRPLSGTILWLALLLVAATLFKPVKKLLVNSKDD